MQIRDRGKRKVGEGVKVEVGWGEEMAEDRGLPASPTLLAARS